MSRRGFGMPMGGGPSGYRSLKTPEQIAFDNEFEKWEKSFEDWKLVNRNHPDPEEYRYYENKFLEVRRKLILKRNELYDEPTRAPFDDHLSAADAMASSILSMFDGSSSNSNRPRSLMNFNNDGAGRPSYGQGYGRSGPIGQDRQSEWLLSALSRVLNSGRDSHGGRDSYGGRFDPYSRFGGRDRRDGPPRRNGHPGRDRRDGPPILTGRDRPGRPRHRLNSEERKESNELFYAKLDKMYEEAEKSEFPRYFSGAIKRRVRYIRDKKEEDRNENEKRLIELNELVYQKRRAFHEKQRKEKAEQEAAEKAAEKAGEEGEGKESAKDTDKGEDVEMKEVEDEKTVEATAEKEAEPSAEKEAEIPADMDAEMPADKEAEPSADKEAEPSADKEVEPSADKEVEPSADKEAETKA